MLIYTRNILQLILAPSKGWEDVSGSGTPTHTLLYRGTYPYFILAALSVFVRLIYAPSTSIVYLVEMATVVFVSLFVNFYFALVMFKMFFSHYCEGEPNERKFTTVILYVMGLLALSNIVCNLLPKMPGFDYLLPFAVSLVLWKANIYLRVNPAKDLAFALFGFITVILPGVLLQQLFDNILQ